MITELHQLKLDMQEFIINLNLRIESISNLISKQHFIEVNDRLLFLAEDLGVLADTINSLQATIPSLDLNELNEKLQDLVQAMEEQNYLLIMDVISIELKPLLEYWSELTRDA
ncbi:hypothetical protein RAC89_12585 [Paenibacillus sp. GD4]|uniref:hypothetical protein n=1 Tax=Paenibacillus sp. GD4 TaxID=3068890 RepID=UPI0027966488|nr:hypothetical protein [Paenibacillus sp. GD4]MDQ1911283.1 hypothetical protein [Paenibacillus sp. GD4]